MFCCLWLVDPASFVTFISFLKRQLHTRTLHSKDFQTNSTLTFIMNWNSLLTIDYVLGTKNYSFYNAKLFWKHLLRNRMINRLRPVCSPDAWDWVENWTTYWRLHIVRLCEYIRVQLKFGQYFSWRLRCRQIYWKK